MSKRGMLNTEG